MLTPQVTRLQGACAWCTSHAVLTAVRYVRCCYPAGRGASSGVGFAIPIDQVKGLVEQILTYGRVMRPVLGVTIAPQQVRRC